MSLGSQNSKWSHNTLTASQLAGFDDEMLLDAPPGYGATPALPVNVVKTLLAAAEIPLFSRPADVLDEYDAVGPFLAVAFIPVEHLSHLIWHRADVLFLRKMVCLFAVAADMTDLGPTGDGSNP